MKKILVFNGPRVGYLRWIIDGFYKSNLLELQLYVTSMHLSAELGATYQEIVKTSICLIQKVEMLLGADTPTVIT